MAINSTVTDFHAVKKRQQSTWASGNYAAVGVTLQLVGERLCEAVDLRAGERVLDVAAGNGNATLAAARRFARVTSTDYVGALLEVGQQRAAAETLSVQFQEADAEALPFADDSFDVVLSSFGVMFAPNQGLAAAEMARVLRRGGRIGLANWTPEGFIGLIFAIIGRYAPPPPGVRSPAQWGLESRLAALFPGCEIRATRQSFKFRYESSRHWLNFFKKNYGPINRAFATLDPEEAAFLEAEIIALLESLNLGGSESLVVPSEYLEVVITKG